MRFFHRVVLIAGVAAIAVLLFKLDARAVLALVAQVGWGILLVLGQEIVPIALNAVGWRLSFRPGDARSYHVLDLGRLWLAMDGLNYLIPTGTIAGEVARAAMLPDRHPVEVRAASVIVSRLAQTVAQIGLILTGFVFLVSGISRIARHSWIGTTAACLLTLLSAAFTLYLLVAHRWIRSGDGSSAAGPPPESRRREVSRQLRLYFQGHPRRFAASVGVFAAAYAWLALEGWLICRLIGEPVTFRTAFTIEVLSVAIDGLLFLVPAKIGTQELGKAAIFSLLGLPVRSGLAFGIVRHVRELAWAVTGFLIYSARRRRTARIAAPGGDDGWQRGRDRGTRQA